MTKECEKLEKRLFADLLPLAQDEVSRCVVELARSEPFYGHVLGGLQRHFTDRIETLAVGLRGDSVQLLVNPKFFLKGLKKPQHRTAVLKHEVLHIVFKHIFRSPSLKHDPFLWNIAADLVVNQYVSPYRLPDGAILLSTFPDLNLAHDDTADSYYSALLRLKDDLSKKRKSSKYPKSADSLIEIFKQNPPSDHTCWADAVGPDIDGERTGSSISPVVREALRQISEEQILKAHERAKASRVPGAMPSWLDRYIQDLLDSKQPQINWRQAIRMFSSSTRRSKMIATLQRESRRFEVPNGFPHNPGMKLRRFQKMAVAIDTSGSIDDNTLTTFFSEVHGIYKQGAAITIIECDADIRRTYQYTGKVPEYVKGGGGTSFEPVMRWLINTTMRFDGCVYLTDGFGDAPESKPPCKLLWVVSGGEGGDHLRFGKHVVLRS